MEKSIDDLHGGKIVDLDISDPAHPHQVDAIELGPGSGPHMAMVMGMGGEQQLVVSDYFLNQDIRTPHKSKGKKKENDKNCFR